MGWQLIVEDIQRSWTGDGWRLSGAVRAKSGLGADRLEFTVHDGEPDWMPETGDAFLAALLMPAMSLAEELVIDAPVSPRLLRSAHTVMEIYQAWWGELQPVEFTAAGPASPVHHRNAVGLFFTTGVDCFYSLLKDAGRRARPEHQPVTDLVFANFEQHTGRGHDAFLGRVRDVAAQSGCRAVIVETNIRAMTDPLVHWEAYHGAALGSVALALQGLMGRCLVAASDVYRHLPALGSHPVLDHLWSTERLEIVHDGAEATRTDKVERQLRHSRLALDNLEVCWESRTPGNCGRCEKCLRTMAALELAHVLDRCRTLPRTLDLDLLRSVRLRSEGSRESMHSLAADARDRCRYDIAEAAEEALRRCASSPSGPGAQ